MKKILSYTLPLALIAGLSFAFACQKTQLADYKKFQNDAEVPRISIEDAKKDFDAVSTVIVDSRDAAAYKQEHIKGSINIPSGSPEAMFDTIPKGKKIIVYCS